jgi:hypothetical protein
MISECKIGESGEVLELIPISVKLASKLLAKLLSKIIATGLIDG